MVKQDLKKDTRLEYFFSAGNITCAMCGVYYHRAASERSLEFEDFMETSSLCLPKLLLWHLHHKAHGGVGVVFPEVGDQRGNLLSAIHHRL